MIRPSSCWLVVWVAIFGKTAWGLTLNPDLLNAVCVERVVAVRADNAQAAGELERLYQDATAAELKMELSRAAAAYEELVRRCDLPVQRAMAIKAQEGLRRVADLKADFAWTQAELDRQLAKTFVGYRPDELSQWERGGWLYTQVVDGQKRYCIANATNLAFFDTAIRRRNPALTVGDKTFAKIYLDTATQLDALRAAPGPPQRYVLPQKMVYTVKAVVHHTDLPPGPLIRAWFPVPLSTPAMRTIRVVGVEPAGALVAPPNVEYDLGVAYLEVPRPRAGDLVIRVDVAFDTYHSDFVVQPDRIGPYDESSELYRRFTRSEPQIAVNEPTIELARSIVGSESNPYHKARRLYDWVCDHCTYNYVWRQRDTTFTLGCASEEVRQRRIGDCVLQSMFYAALCRSVGIPARILNGPVFPPCFKNDHVWAEVYMPSYGWLPVDVTYSEVITMAPDLTDAQRRRLRDFFFVRGDRWRFASQRYELLQPLVPAKLSPRKRATMFTHPEFECGGQDVEKAAVTWECKEPELHNESTDPTRVTAGFRTLPVAPLGPPNPWPRFRFQIPAQPINVPADLSAEDRAGMFLDAAVPPLPYLIQDNYTRQRHEGRMPTIQFENAALRATFYPSLGGRMTSLYDKRGERELLFDNPVVQFANLAIRNAWFSGGVEWNGPLYGHSLLTCSPVFTGLVETSRGPLLRLYDFDRALETTWQVDVFLPNGDDRLWTHVKALNPTDVNIFG